jgi:hypothetical protein
MKSTRMLSLLVLGSNFCIVTACGGGGGNSAAAPAAAKVSESRTYEGMVTEQAYFTTR